MTDFILSFPQTAMLKGSHDAALVVLSVLVAALASYTALTLSNRIVASAKGGHLWLGFGALSMGTGIWAMHFIGMLAVSLPVSVSFHGGFTLLSFLPALLASVVAVQGLARPQRSPALIATLPALP